MSIAALVTNGIGPGSSVPFLLTLGLGGYGGGVTPPTPEPTLPGGGKSSYFPPYKPTKKKPEPPKKRSKPKYTRVELPEEPVLLERGPFDLIGKFLSPVPFKMGMADSLVLGVNPFPDDEEDIEILLLSL